MAKQTATAFIFATPKTTQSRSGDSDISSQENSGLWLSALTPNCHYQKPEKQQKSCQPELPLAMM